MPDPAMPRPTTGPQHAQASASDDGLIRLRRQSDWTRRPRPDDEAAEAAYRAALGLATATLAAYDGGTASHSDDVITLSLAIAEELGVTGRERAYLLAAAELHDIGKVAVPADILHKSAPLDDTEWELVRKHPATGQRILGAVPELSDVARIVRHCHERWDGGGYPDGLSAEQIPLGARIVFCADAFHAIRSDRPYRRGRSARAALDEVTAHSGTQFDPAVVKALVRVRADMRGGRSLGRSLVMGGRSQRLAALLLTLVVAGGALAATGIWNPAGGKAANPRSDRPAPNSAPAQDQAVEAAPADEAAEAASRPAAELPAARRAARRAADRAALPEPASGPAAPSSGAGIENQSRDEGAADPAGDGGGGGTGGARGTPVSREPSGAPPPARSPARKAPAERAPSQRAPRRVAKAPAARPPAVAPSPAPSPAPVPAPLPPDDQGETDADGHGGGQGPNGNGNGHDKGRGGGHEKHGDG